MTAVIADAGDYFASRISYAPKRVFNAYPSDYRPGDFVVHFAGTHNAAQLRAYFTRYGALAPSNYSRLPAHSARRIIA